MFQLDEIVKIARVAAGQASDSEGSGNLKFVQTPFSLQEAQPWTNQY